MENWLVHFSSKYLNDRRVCFERSFVIFEIFEQSCSIVISLIVVMESFYVNVFSLNVE